jgi:hypothetical protein
LTVHDTKARPVDKDNNKSKGSIADIPTRNEAKNAMGENVPYVLSASVLLYSYFWALHIRSTEADALWPIIA